MNVTVVGTGYVGLVSGACFAETGNDVICMDTDADKVARMQAGEVPIYEPGLEDIVRRNTAEGRLHFTDNLRDAVLEAEVILLALPTPNVPNGHEVDLSYVLGAAKDIGGLLNKYSVIVGKSTVPVGTSRKVREVVEAETDVAFDVVSNPEFLREGQAVKDFLNPDQIIVGASSERAEAVMRRLYGPFVRRNPKVLDVMDPESAETVKYAINSFLAVKISYANQIALLSEAAGADYSRVREALGRDSRIGSDFLYTGPGWGGSCFPKDTRATVDMANELGVDLSIVQAAVESNESQKREIPGRVLEYFGFDLEGKTIALWGLAFKDNTDDIRESPALAMIDVLTENGANVVAFDPQAMDNVKKQRGDNPRLTFAENDYAALVDADALVIATNWKEFFNPNYDRVKQLMKEPVVFDGRNLWEPAEMEELGFYYNCLGSSTVDGRAKAELEA